jgi:hypothetical protein
MNAPFSISLFARGWIIFENCKSTRREETINHDCKLGKLRGDESQSFSLE